jgi:hypothetical protein
VFYRDNDSDMFGDPMTSLQQCGASAPMGYVSAAGDCCDRDARARPGQTGLFPVPRAGCGGYDYDCSGMEELEFNSANGSPCTNAQMPQVCDLHCTSAGQRGWLGANVMPCGDAGVYYDGCYTNAYDDPPYCYVQECVQNDAVRVQRCR